jgi:hypothetical protein
VAKFFETFNVVEEDGNWQQGYVKDTLGEGFHLFTQDICDPTAPGPLPDSEMGKRIYPFAITAYQEIPPRCAPEYVGAFVDEAFRAATETAVSKYLWEGTAETESTMYLTHGDVEEITRGADAYTTVGSLLERAYEKTPFLRPTIHLGWQSALALQFGLTTLGLPYVVPHGYPANAIAVTGPVTIRLGSVQNISRTDIKINRTYFEATRIAAIEFDPAQAVRSS